MFWFGLVWFGLTRFVGLYKKVNNIVFFFLWLFKKFIFVCWFGWLFNCSVVKLVSLLVGLLIGCLLASLWFARLLVCVFVCLFVCLLALYICISFLFYFSFASFCTAFFRFTCVVFGCVPILLLCCSYGLCTFVVSSLSSVDL